MQQKQYLTVNSALNQNTLRQQLLRITEHISNGFEKKEHTGAAFLDIANAFDKV